jgi:hypothetical protein
MTRSPRRLREQVKETVSELPIHAARLAVMGVGRALLLTDRVRKDYKQARESGVGPVLGRLRDDAENMTGKAVGKVTDRLSGDGHAGKESRPRSAADSEIAVGKPKAASARPKPAATPPKPTTARAPKPAAAAQAKPAAAPPKPAAARPRAATEQPKPAAEPKPAAARPRPATEQPKPAAEPKPAAARPRPATEQPKPAAEPKQPAAAGARELPVSGYDEASIASVRARLRGLDTRQVTELRDYERAHAARADFLRMYGNRIAKLRGGG